MDELSQEPMIPQTAEEMEAQAPCGEPVQEEDTPLASPEPEPSETSREELAREVLRLTEELTRLRKELNREQEERSRSLAELEEFSLLFPHVPLKDIPESVRRQAAEGIPLSAAYALYEKKVLAAEAHAKQINQRNAALSAGRAGKDASEEYFSPEEVRAMSQRQVHENYTRILESMKSWI